VQILSIDVEGEAAKMPSTYTSEERAMFPAQFARVIKLMDLIQFVRGGGRGGMGRRMGRERAREEGKI
jgi:hypothetical protein